MTNALRFTVRAFIGDLCPERPRLRPGQGERVVLVARVHRQVRAGGRSLQLLVVPHVLAGPGAVGEPRRARALHG